MRADEIVYTKSPLKAEPYGIIQSNHGKTGIVSTLYAVFKANDNCCSHFVEDYFALTTKLNNYLHLLVNKGAKNTLLISDEGSLNGAVVFPSTKAEQEAIHSLFAGLDESIALHQRKSFLIFLDFMGTVQNFHITHLSIIGCASFGGLDIPGGGINQTMPHHL